LRAGHEGTTFEGSEMYQVRATVVAFMGDTSLYPCHMKHQVGDEVVFDGECYHGRLCPDVWPLIAPKVSALHMAGPRYVEPLFYYPHWYCPPSVPDAAEEKNDGLGFKNVLETIVPPTHDMANLRPPQSFIWPPDEGAGIGRQMNVICPDSRTSMVIRLEAFALSEKGFDTPYFRRQMAILAKLETSGPLAADKLLDAFTKQEIEGIYPALSAIVLAMLADELEALGYVVTSEGQMSITAKGATKLADFRQSLPRDHLEAFQKYVL
jgi:uncharacterized repeat protein (TIGR04076 family)